MRIRIVTPKPRGSRCGNRVAAERWARLLRALGHRVSVEQYYNGGSCDLLIAVHARKSAAAIRRFRREYADAPLIVVLAGTDLYGDIHTSAEAQRSLRLASRLVLLQPKGMEVLPRGVRDRVRVIFQSARRPPGTFAPKRGTFEVGVLGHLRPVKDPFRTALAARLLPASSRIRVLHLGAALSKRVERRARAEEKANPRYRWLGSRPRWQALRILARCRLMVLTSKSEGGANVVSEAIVSSVPVISSRIAGSLGLLGERYPGYFPVGDTAALAALLERAETDAAFYAKLSKRCDRLAPLFDPARERHSWRELLAELLPACRCSSHNL